MSMREKNIIQYSYFRKYVNPGYIHWTKGLTCNLPVLSHLLIYTYQMLITVS